MDIIAMGEPLMELSDIESEGRRVYLPGFGGDTSNFVVSAARQGASTAYFTHVGADAFGGSLFEPVGVGRRGYFIYCAVFRSTYRDLFHYVQ